MARWVNHYDILGLSYGCTEEEIQQAFRRLAKRYHPDAIAENGSEEAIQLQTQKFRHVLTAYQVLMDKNQRQSFDKKLLSSHNMIHVDHQTYPRLHSTQVRYTSSLREMIGKGLLKKKVSRKDRVHELGSDMTLFLTSREIQSGVVAPIPVPARCVCDLCYGEDRICPLCHGIGRISKMKTVYALIPPNAQDNSIIELDLSQHKASPLTYFTIQSITLRIKHLAIINEQQLFYKSLI